MLRTADAAGAQAVVFADASVDPYNGKCVRASAGSLFHLPVVAGARLEEAVVAMREAGLRIVAADGRAGRPLDDPDVQARLSEPTAWMFGNEAWGSPPIWSRWPMSRSRCPFTGTRRASTWPRRGSVSLRVRACTASTPCNGTSWDVHSIWWRRVFGLGRREFASQDCHNDGLSARV